MTKIHTRQLYDPEPDPQSHQQLLDSFRPQPRLARELVAAFHVVLNTWCSIHKRARIVSREGDFSKRQPATFYRLVHSRRTACQKSYEDSCTVTARLRALELHNRSCASSQRDPFRGVYIIRGVHCTAQLSILFWK
jgi:hypothetical protein